MKTDSYPRISGIVISILTIILFGVSYSFFTPEYVAVWPSTPHLSLGIAEGALYGTGALSIVLGIISIILIAISIYLFSNFIYGNTAIPMLFYLTLVLSNPSSIYFSNLHIAALLLAWGLFSMIDYKAALEEKTEKMFISFFLLTLASLFYAPLFWILPLLILYIFCSTASPKKLIISIFGIVTPFIISAAVIYLANGWNTGLFKSFYQSIVFHNEKIISYGIATIIKILIVTIAMIAAVSHSIKKKDFFTKPQAESYMGMFIFTVLLTVIAILFLNNTQVPFSILLFIPVSFFLYELSSKLNIAGKFSIYYSIFCILLLIERMTIILSAY